MKWVKRIAGLLGLAGIAAGVYAAIHRKRWNY